MKYSFKNDYSEGAHTRILEALLSNNSAQQVGYGEDDYCLNAEKLIQNECENSQIKVHFVSGGTQANLLVISSLLKSYESVICAETGHINCNETGAIENCGFKVHSVPNKEGKVTVEGIELILSQNTNFPHQVKPRLVYISNATEVGTLYSKSELNALYTFCQKNNLYLFMDGARLGNALTAENGDVSLKDIAENTDVFYIGGTKNGALFGEAVLFTKGLVSDFRFFMKQKGALLAKGRSVGVQFQTFFENGLYYDLAKHANQQAKKIKKAFTQAGYGFLSDTTTNQLFPILPNNKIEALQQLYDFYVWKKIDENHSAIRLITSWATPDEIVEKFISDVKSL